MSDPPVGGHGPRGETQERSRESILASARPLPPSEDALTEELTEDEDRRFLDAILHA